jgi:hypothetical protein
MTHIQLKKRQNPPFSLFPIFSRNHNRLSRRIHAYGVAKADNRKAAFSRNQNS